jgi:Pleckstrin homology domain
MYFAFHKSIPSLMQTSFSKPIPLEYLQLASFNEAPEVRRERADSGSFINMSSTKQNLYPFTIYHAGAKSTRRYTLYAQTATARDKWHKALVDAIGLRRARQDANKVLLLPFLFSTASRPNVVVCTANTQ